MEQEAKKLGIDITDYFGRDLDVFIYNVEDASHNIRPYLFVFEGSKLIVAKDLEREENEVNARDLENLKQRQGGDIVTF